MLLGVCLNQIGVEMNSNEIVLDISEKELLLKECKNIEVDEEHYICFKPRLRNSLTSLYAVLDKLEIGYCGEVKKTKKKDEEEREKEKVSLCITCRQAEKFHHYKREIESNKDSDQISCFVNTRVDTAILADVEIYRKYLTTMSMTSTPGRPVTTSLSAEIPDYFKSIDLEVEWEELF